MTGEADQVRALTEAAFWAEHHRKRRDNPHEVAAGQVGAATVAGLAAHLADRVNPHGVTAEQVGAALASALSDHLADVSNPHGVTALQVALASAGFGYHPIWHRADTTTITGLTGTVKWYGGVLGPDGKIYGIPCNSTSVLIIDPVAKTADTTTIAGLSADTDKWFGGVLGPDGKIYGIPYNSTSVLIIAGGMPALPIEPLLSPYLNKF